MTSQNGSARRSDNDGRILIITNPEQNHKGIRFVGERMRNDGSIICRKRIG